jgi:flagellar FliL protein
MSAKPAAAPADAKGGKSSKSKLMPIVAAVVLLAGAGGGYFWYSARQAAAAAAAGEEDEEEEHNAEAEDEGATAAPDTDTAADARKTKKAKKRKKKTDEAHPARLMAFEPFVVNLADPGVARFLRTNVQLVVSGGEEGGGHGAAKGPTVEEMRARSAILELLSAETSDKLTTPAGKQDLKEHIIARMEDVLAAAHIEVEDVLFSDFVIQF